MRQLRITPRITQKEGESLDKYFNDIGRIDLLTPEEEVGLARRIRDGDSKALEQLVTANLRFVASVAKQYQNKGLALNDLINEGNLGLIKAAINFDETKGFRFISYAVWWIRQAIIRALEEYSRIVRLPSNQVSNLNKLQKTLTQLEQEYERTPTDDELAAVMNVKSVRVSQYRHVSIDDPIGHEDGGNTMVDVLANREADEPDQQLMDESLKDEILRLLSKLLPREASIISYSFGLYGGPPLTPHEVGQKVGLSRERVRQLRSKAMRKLKKVSLNKSLKSYL